MNPVVSGFTARLIGDVLRITVGARALVQRYAVLSYVVLVYVLGWSWCVPLAVRGDVVRMGVGWPTHLPALVGPALAAIVVTAIVDGRAGLRALWTRVTRWRVGWRWWALVAATLSLALVGVIVPLITGGDLPSLDSFTRYSGIGAITPLGVVAVALLANGLGEETGWRGFAADRLLRDHSFRWTALVVAVAWGGWHLPLDGRWLPRHGPARGRVGGWIGRWLGCVDVALPGGPPQRAARRSLAHSIQPHLGYGGDWCGGRDGHQPGRDRLGSVGPQARTGRTASRHRFSRAGFTATR